MPIQWRNRFNVSDVFHNDDLTLEQKRDAIVRRIRATRWYDEDDEDLFQAVVLLADAVDTDEFDEAWGQLYDWADEDHRLWIQT